jgi:hypothetical protein
MRRQTSNKDKPSWAAAHQRIMKIGKSIFGIKMLASVGGDIILVRILEKLNCYMQSIV